ncbi:MAG: acyl-CoA carboxylase epsilon subunit [Actinomycetes bacterium]
MTADPALTPAFEVVGGQPSDVELAALAAVLASVRRERGRPHAPASPAIAGGWRSHWHLVRGSLLQGEGAWRSTARR